MKGLVVALVLGGGLLLAAAAAADWTAEAVVREVGGVPVTEVETTAGTHFAPGPVRHGLLATLCGLALAVLRGLPRRLAGALASALGALALVGLVPAWRAASEVPGELTAAPVVAGLGAIAVALGGLAAALRPAPPSGLGPRYSIDEGAEDPEWDDAADEGPPTMPS